MNRMAGLVVLVSGASGAVGEAVIRRLEAEGAHVVAHDAQADASAAIEEAVDRFGGLDAVVACPEAQPGDGALTDVTPEGWTHAMRTVVDAFAALAQAALPALTASQGAIVVVSATAALAGGTRSASRQAAMAALLGLVGSLAREHDDAGVRVNAVCPGGGPAAPLGRAATPDEVAAACVFLASPESASLTGAALVVDGGELALNSGTVAFAGAGD